MRHLVDVLKDRCLRSPDKAAFLVKQRGAWNPVPWSKVNEKSDQIAAGLLSMDLAPGDCVSILGNTRLEWTLSDLGILKAGCVSIGIYQTLSGEQSAYILKDSNTKALFIENQAQIEKIKPHLDKLPNFRWFIVWDKTGEGHNIISLDRTHAKRRKHAQSQIRNALSESRRRFGLKTSAIIIYTSGTTGPPKGACLTHQNFLAELKATEVVKQKDIGDIMMFFLPLSHVGERIAQFLRIRRGITGAYVEDIKKILDDIKEIRPTFFGSVPRIFEKAFARIRAQVDAAPPIKQKLFYWAEKIGREVSRKPARRSGDPAGT